MPTLGVPPSTIGATVGTSEIEDAAVTAAKIADSVRSSILPFGFEGADLATATTHYNPPSNVDTVVTGGTRSRTPIGRAGVLRTMYVKHTTAPTAGTTVTYQCRVNGANVGAAITFVNADGSGAVKNVALDAALAAGDDVDVAVSHNNAGAHSIDHNGSLLVEVD